VGGNRRSEKILPVKCEPVNTDECVVVVFFLVWKMGRGQFVCFFFSPAERFPLMPSRPGSVYVCVRVRVCKAALWRTRVNLFVQRECDESHASRAHCCCCCCCCCCWISDAVCLQQRRHTHSASCPTPSGLHARYILKQGRERERERKGIGLGVEPMNWHERKGEKFILFSLMRTDCFHTPRCDPPSCLTFIGLFSLSLLSLFHRRHKDSPHSLPHRFGCLFVCSWAESLQDGRRTFASPFL